ncbi:tetratricopeptide repeat protein [Frateuria aurantia]
MRRFGCCGVVWAGLLTACTTAPRHPVSSPSQAQQPLTQIVVATPDEDHDLIAQLLLGEDALSHSDLKTAAQAYIKASQLSDEAQVSERATELALAVHDLPAAGRTLARWHQLGGAADVLAQADATLALAQGQTSQAIEDARRLVATGEPHVWERLVRVLAAGHPDPAVAGQVLAAVATPERLPNDSQVWIAMSSLALRLGRADVAQTLAQQAVQRFHSAAAYAWAGQLQFESGHPDQGRSLLEQALQKDPSNPRWRLLYASLLSQAGAQQRAAHLLADGPQSLQIYQLRVALAAHGHQQQQLQSIYQQLRQAHSPLREQAAYLLGQLAELLNRPGEALDWYDQVGDDDPHAFDADLRTAVIQANQARLDDAHAQLARMQSDYLDQPGQLRQIDELDAILYMRQHRYPEAVAAYTAALGYSPDDSGLLYDRGIAHASAGQVDASIADFRQVLRLKPGDIDASNALGFTLADSNRDLSEAEQLIAVARQARPDDPVINDSWGWLQYRLGHLPQAEQVLSAAWQHEPDPDIGVHLGEVLWQAGQKDRARQLFQHIQQQDPHNPALQQTLGRLHP